MNVVMLSADRGPIAFPARRRATLVLAAVALLRVSVVLASLGALGAFAAGAGAIKRMEEAANFFESGSIPHLRIRVAETNLARLRSDARAYVRSTVREGDRTYEEVGIHLKGAAGSFQGVDSRPALTLNFDKFVDDQHFHGIDKLSLNNSVQDSSYLTEGVCADLFLAAGVPTPRVTHARVELNGRDLGLYVLKEGFDKAFLRRHFKNVNGNLYDGGFLHEITEPLERTSGEGDVRGRADLKALAEAALEPDHQRRLERLQQVLDFDRFLSFCVLEMFTWHWDGYTLKKNNYRIYHDPDSQKLVFLPHGMDQMFWHPNERVVPARGQAEGLIVRALLETDAGQRLYRERAASLATNVFTAQRLTNQIQRMRVRVRPALAAIHPDLAQQHDQQVTRLLNLVLARARRVREILAEPEPEPMRFNAAGEGSPVRWYPLTFEPDDTSTLDQQTNASSMKTLHIAAGPAGRCTASWRARAMLPAGNYVFSGRVRTRGVTPLVKDVRTKGLGAGIRQSLRQPRQHGLVGDSDWQTVEYEVTVNGDSDEVTLICELRAEQGEAWFDLNALKVRKK